MTTFKDKLKKYAGLHKVALIFLLVCILVIFVSSFAASAVQSDGFSVSVTDLRDQKNTGSKIVIKNGVETPTKVDGKVVSGILFKPKAASATNKLPGVVLTHGYLNSRELQLQNAIELARRGFVVLTVDREGHGNYENTGDQNAMMATNGLYDSAKYLYNLDYVDQSKIGISGHSMGGYTTAATLMTDNAATGGLGIVSAGLMQAWSSFMGAGPNVDVGFLKARDDEFFFTTKEDGGTISRDYLKTKTAKSFIGNPALEGAVVSGQIYIGGQAVETEGGVAPNGALRVIYEVPGIHPQNHCSVPGAAAVTDFFYNSFGTPNGTTYLNENSQTWWVKEMFSLLGLIAFFALIFPFVSLMLTIPFFQSISIRKNKQSADGIEMADTALAEDSPEAINTGATVMADAAVGTDAAVMTEATPQATMVIKKKHKALLDSNTLVEAKPLKGIQKHLSYWLGAIACAIFSGFVIFDIFTKYADKWFPLTQLYPQDTTNSVALWAVVSAMFSLAVILFFWAVNAVVNKIRYKEKASLYNENPFASGRMQTGVVGFLKTILLAIIVVFSLYLILFINWKAWMVDFRIWTFDVKTFDVGVMLPTMVRYMLFFGFFFTISALFSENYRAKNLPEWATTLIGVFFNIIGVLLVISIQYATFKSTGVLWQPKMDLGYIVLIPMIPILAIATVISRRMTAKTGNIWLGAMINTMLFTIITCANTAASFAYVMG